jgi:hypothetical protein
VLDALFAKAAQIERIYEIVKRGKLPRDGICVGVSHRDTSISILPVDSIDTSYYCLLVLIGDGSMRKTPIFRRILNFLSAWDQKQKDREIGRLIARSGGRFTDELERRIMQGEMASDRSVHRYQS